MRPARRRARGADDASRVYVTGVPAGMAVADRPARRERLDRERQEHREDQSRTGAQGSTQIGPAHDPPTDASVRPIDSVTASRRFRRTEW